MKDGITFKRWSVTDKGHDFEWEEEQVSKDELITMFVPVGIIVYMGKCKNCNMIATKAIGFNSEEIFVLAMNHETDFDLTCDEWCIKSIIK